MAFLAHAQITFRLNYKHVVGRTEQTEVLTCSVPKEAMLEFKNIQDFKRWLVANAHPPLIKQPDAFQIIKMRLVGARTQRDEVQGEPGVLAWLQRLALKKEPILSVTGELERNVRFISVP